jgi:hypothetical protein
MGQSAAQQDNTCLDAWREKEARMAVSALPVEPQVDGWEWLSWLVGRGLGGPSANIFQLMFTS